MTIIDANHYLEQLLSPAELDRIARDCQFCLRKRAITPAMLVTALLRALGCDVSIHRNSIDTGKMRRSSLDPTFLLA